jgi:hypothetical protein
MARFFTASCLGIAMIAVTDVSAAEIIPASRGFKLILADVPETTTDRTTDQESAQQGRILRLIDPEHDRSLALGMLRQSNSAPDMQPAAENPPPAGDAGELAKQLSNPISSLISVPFQFNYDEGFGPNDAPRYTLNFQPVIPVSLNKDWNLIRTILPVVNAESPSAGISSESGLGDTTQSFFFSPAQSDIIWGIGPAFLYPTATASSLGGEKWAVGPTAVALKQHEGWTIGGLFNHLWSFAGDSDRASVNATFLQPFVAYQFPTATTLTANLEMTYDWNAEETNAPLGLFVSQVFKIGDQPVSLQIGPRWYIDSPPGGAEWGFRINFTLLFPAH